MGGASQVGGYRRSSQTVRTRDGIGVCIVCDCSKALHACQQLLMLALWISPPVQEPDCSLSAKEGGELPELF